MKNLFFNSILFVAIVAITAFVFTAGAKSAQDGNESIQEWEACAQNALNEYGQVIMQDPSIFRKDFCDFLGSPVGEECDSVVQIMSMSEELQNSIMMFSLKTVVEPACGTPPKE